MTNAEKLIKKLQEDTDLFARVIRGGLCNAVKCDGDCPLQYVRCCIVDSIKEWLEQEADDENKNAGASL